MLNWIQVVKDGTKNGNEKKLFLNDIGLNFDPSQKKIDLNEIETFLVIVPISFRWSPVSMESFMNGYKDI